MVSEELSRGLEEEKSKLESIEKVIIKKSEELQNIITSGWAELMKEYVKSIVFDQEPRITKDMNDEYRETLKEELIDIYANTDEIFKSSAEYLRMNIREANSRNRRGGEYKRSKVIPIIQDQMELAMSFVIERLMAYGYLSKQKPVQIKDIKGKIQRLRHDRRLSPKLAMKHLCGEVSEEEIPQEIFEAHKELTKLSVEKAQIEKKIQKLEHDIDREEARVKW